MNDAHWMGLALDEARLAGIAEAVDAVADLPDPTRLFQADRIHPTEAAHPIILVNVWPALRKILK